MPVIKTNASALLGVPIDDTDKGANKILKYNATSGKFEYETDATATPDAGATQMSELSDVADTISISAGHYLRSGTETWSNSAIVAADLPTAIDAAKIANGNVSNTEFQYLDGVTSAIQTQLNAKAASSHTHAGSDIASGSVAVAQGGTGGTDAAQARTNLGLVIGTNVQAYDATLATLATLGTAANKVPYFTATDTGGELTLRTTLRDAGVADDTSLATEAAVRAAIVAGAGDVTSNTSSSVVNELAAFADTGGKLIKRTTESGIAKLASGVLSVVTAPSGTIVGTTDTQTLSNKTLQDSTTVFQDNADATKQFRFEVSSVTAGQTRVLTVPNADLTLATLTGTETFTNKTLTNPTLNAGDGVLVVPQKATPDQTAEGSVQWDTDGDLLTVGTGAARKTMVDTDSTQTLAAKTLTTPTISATGFTNANHAHSATNSGGQLDLTAIASNTPTARHALIANSTGSAWETRALVIADISDVTTATGTQNDLLVKGASTWETKSPGQVRTVLQVGSHPTTTVDNTVARYDGTTGDLQASGVTIDDSVNLGVSGHVTLGGGAASSEVRILEPSAGGSSYTGFKAPALGGNVVYTLPTAAGSDGQYLKTNGSAELAWASPAGAGDVLGPSTSADNTIPRFDGTDSKTIQASTLTLSDTGTMAAASGVLTLTSPYLTTPQINDTSADHQYVLAVGELSADRTVTLPVLTGADTFVFEAHTQNLTNKTVNKVTLTAPANAATLTLADGSTLITSGANSLTLTTTGTANVTFPSSTFTVMGLGVSQTVTGTKTFNSGTLVATSPRFTSPEVNAIDGAGYGSACITLTDVDTGTPNYIDVANSTSSASPSISAAGAGTNIDLNLKTKGTGALKLYGAKTTATSADFSKRNVQVKVVDDATATSTGDGKAIFCVPPELDGMDFVDVDAYITTTSSSGLVTVMVRNVTDAVDVLSTAITIDAGEFTSYTAVTPPVISSTASYRTVATGDLIAIDVDGAGTGTKGLGVSMAFALP